MEKELKKKLEEVNHLLKYIYNNELVKSHGEAEILHQSIYHQISQINYSLGVNINTGA